MNLCVFEIMIFIIIYKLMYMNINDFSFYFVFFFEDYMVFEIVIWNGGFWKIFFD